MSLLCALRFASVIDCTSISNVIPEDAVDEYNHIRSRLNVTRRVHISGRYRRLRWYLRSRFPTPAMNTRDDHCNDNKQRASREPYSLHERFHPELVAPSRAASGPSI